MSTIEAVVLMLTWGFMIGSDVLTAALIVTELARRNVWWKKVVVRAFGALIIIAVLEYYVVPASTILDARVVFGNTGLARALGLADEMSAWELVAPGLETPVVLMAEVIVAVAFSSWLMRSKV